MSKVHQGLEAKEFTDSEYAVEKYYCTASGDLATASCPSKAVGWYKKNNIPANCSTHAGEALPPPSAETEATPEGETPPAATESAPQTTE